MDIDARPSDAIALAIRYKVPIFIHKDVYEMAGIVVKDSTDSVEENQSEIPVLQPSPINTMEKLKNDLQRALAEERYEEAAKLRDQLKQLEAGN